MILNDIVGAGGGGRWFRGWILSEIVGGGRVVSGLRAYGKWWKYF